MQRIGIALWDGVEELEFAGPYEVLTAWGRRNDVEVVTIATPRSRALRARPPRPTHRRAC